MKRQIPDSKKILTEQKCDKEEKAQAKYAHMNKWLNKKKYIKWLPPKKMWQRITTRTCKGTYTT